jgi:hypothetical protein
LNLALSGRNGHNDSVHGRLFGQQGDVSKCSKCHKVTE